MKKLSVCIIAKDEEKMIGECLDSVASVADEIILLDTGSRDRTREIAHEKGAAVYQSVWQDDFSLARNEAIDKATGEFILCIDADERLLSPDELMLTLNSAKPQTGGLLIEVVSGAKGLQDVQSNYASSLLRLFRNHKGIRYEGIVHEQIINSLKKAGLTIENTNIKISHLGYDLSFEEMKKKHERNLALLHKWLLANPNDSYNLTQRAKTLTALNRNSEAHSDYVRALEIIPTSNQMRTRALNYGAINAYRIGEGEQALSWALESLELIPQQTFAHFILGEIHFEMKKYITAYEHYAAMRLISQAPPDAMALLAGDYSIPQDVLAYKIGRCHFYHKDYQSASREYSISFELNTKNVMGLVGLANIAFNLKKYKESKALLETALEIDPAQDEINYYLNQIEIATKGIDFEQVEENAQIIENRNSVSSSSINSNPNIVSNSISENNKYANESSQKSVRLSVSMIIKNEEKMLAECLESVKDAADEIIIVDTGSTDRSKEIAARYGAKIYDFAWADDFSEARNFSLSQCTGDWVLYIDADERLTPESGRYIKNYISSALPEIGGFLCTIESEHSQLDGSLEKHRGSYPRLFRNLGYPRVKFQGRVHEQISPSLVENGLNFAVTDLVITHLGYNQPYEVMQQKVKRNYTMLLAHIKEEPTNGYAWFQLGQTLGQMNLKKEAEEAIKFAISCGNLTDTIYSSATAVLAQFSGNGRRFAESLDWAEKSLVKSPNQIYTLSLKGNALLNLGRKNEAREAFEAAKSLILTGKTPALGAAGFDVVLPLSVVEDWIELTEK